MRKIFTLLVAMYFILAAVVAVAQPTDVRAQEDDQPLGTYSATHTLHFVKTTGTLKVGWCAIEGWTCEDSEIRGWEYGREQYYVIEDKDGDPHNAYYEFSIPKAGLWRIEFRYKLNGTWHSWTQSTKSNTNVADCGEDGISPHGWWLYVELGTVSGGGID